MVFYLFSFFSGWEG